jgi:hypothetical protein
LLHLHFLFATERHPFSGLGAEDFRSAFLAAIAFAQLSHKNLTLKRECPFYFLISITSLQQTRVPLPGLVTMNSAPHFLQIYRLPTSFAISQFSF